MIILSLITAFLSLVFLFYMFYVFILNRGAVFYPSADLAIQKMLHSVKANKKDTLIDFGSGDGKVVIAAAQKGIQAIGYELDPLLVYPSRKKIKELGLEKLAQIRMTNMYQADFSEGSILYFYQLPEYLKRFKRLLDENISKKTLVISNRYPFPDKKPFKITDKIYWYWWGK